MSRALMYVIIKTDLLSIMIFQWHTNFTMRINFDGYEVNLAMLYISLLKGNMQSSIDYYRFPGSGSTYKVQ